MPPWIGFFDADGAPAIKVKLTGIELPSPIEEYEAIIDTGCSGFISVPRSKAAQVGITSYTTIYVTLADGTTLLHLAGDCMIDVGGERNIGLAILEEDDECDILLGMSFLRIFERALIVQPNRGVVLLVNEREVEAFVDQNLSNALDALPTTPSN
jgi:predicted aspartyl protease